MSTKQAEAQRTWRRGELLAELFLQDLNPEFVARSTADDFAFDFLVGFTNKEGGVNTCAVEVKATEKRPIASRFPVSRELFNRLTHSNIPLMLLVVDVKRNELFYAWPSADADKKPATNTVSIPLTPINDESRAALRLQMAG